MCVNQDQELAMNESSQSVESPRQSETILDRIKYIMSTSRLNQSAFARRLGVDSPYISKIMSGRLAISEGFINRIAIDMGVSKQWLKYGTDVPFPKPTHAATIEARVNPEPAAELHSGIPVYDVDATAGSAELSRMLTDDRVIGYVDLPQVNPECVIIRVSGDSMSPSINNGSFVAIRPVSATGIIFWGQIYVVVTENYRMVKYLRRHDNPDYVVLHSDNPAYDDIDMPRSDIQDLYIVETVINYDRRC